MSSVISIFLNTKNIIIKIKENATKEEIVRELQLKLPDLKRFYKEEKTPILVAGKTLKSYEMDEIQAIIQKAINVKVYFETPKNLGLHVIKRNFRKEIATSDTKFYKGSLRSGQRIEFEGSVVVLGDVNSGAEVIAEDNIVVLGSLRGMAHAGAKGNEQAIIGAHIIDSPQIRIANIIKERTREEVEIEAYSYAFVNQDGKIEFE